MNYEHNGLKYEKVRTLYRGETLYRSVEPQVYSGYVGKKRVNWKAKSSVITNRPLKLRKNYIKEKKRKEEEDLKKKK